MAPTSFKVAGVAHVTFLLDRAGPEQLLEAYTLDSCEHSGAKGLFPKCIIQHFGKTRERKQDRMPPSPRSLYRVRSASAPAVRGLLSQGSLPGASLRVSI